MPKIVPEQGGRDKNPTHSSRCDSLLGRGCDCRSPFSDCRNCDYTDDACRDGLARLGLPCCLDCDHRLAAT